MRTCYGMTTFFRCFFSILLFCIDIRAVIRAWKRVEIGLGLLEMSLPSRSFRVGLGDQRADRQLGEINGGYRWRGRQMSRVCQPRKKDNRAGVQNPLIVHRDKSINSSRSRLKLSRSTAGRFFQRSRRVAESMPGLVSGRSSATGRPARVTVRLSPDKTRITTSPP